MKRQPLHLLWFALLAFLFSHCTMEKRLYNRGFHIENKRTFQTNKTEEPTKPDVIYEDFSSDESATTDELILEEAFLSPETKVTEEVQDSTVLVEPTKVVKDTVYIYDDYEDNIRKKQRRLFFTGVPLLGTGFVAASLLSTATAAGANLYEFFVLGAAGWFFAAIAGTLLLIFIIFLCIPANPEVKKKAPEEKATGKKSKLSKGENAALTICLLAFGLIGLGFLAANVF